MSVIFFHPLPFFFKDIWISHFRIWVRHPPSLLAFQNLSLLIISSISWKRKQNLPPVAMHQPRFCRGLGKHDIREHWYRRQVIEWMSCNCWTSAKYKTIDGFSVMYLFHSNLILNTALQKNVLSSFWKFLKCFQGTRY